MCVSTKAISPDHYAAFRDFLEQSCGILLGDNKQYLVTSRLGNLMTREKLADLGQLVQRVKRSGESGFRNQVIEAMTTNETQWFRDGYPFTIVQEKLFPEFSTKGKQRIRIWSAACSSGQEAYSLSMLLQEQKTRGGTLEGEILGTDISQAMVSHTLEGRYNAAAMRRGLGPDRQGRFFRELGEDQWQTLPEIRSRIKAQVHNLRESYAPLGRFDLIFCRNVLIYFSSELREDILRRMCQQLNPGGYLIVGASESLSRHADQLEMIRTHGGVIYKLRERLKA